MSRVATAGPSGDQVTTKLREDGRATIQFHSSPERLEKWFASIQHNIRHNSFTGKDSKQEQATASSNTLPGPRLNVAIHIVGSRGDVQPFIPIAQLLMKSPYNYRVRICTHPVFKTFVESNGVEFFNIGGDPEALMSYMVRNPGLLPSKESRKAGDVGKRRREMYEILEGTWRSCIEPGDGMGERLSASKVQNVGDLFIADVIIANPPSMGHMHCAEKLGIPLHMIFTMPWSPTEEFHHPLASVDITKADTKTINYLSFLMMELLTWQGLGDLINKFRTQELHLDPVSPMWGYQLLNRLRVPYTYLWSDSLIPKPKDWGQHIEITGFSFLPLGNSFTPDDDLASFLAAGPPPIYIGFGSIVVEDPAGLTKMIFDAVKKADVRAIISKGWGGVGDGDVSDDVYLIGNCPHDWLFRQVSAVVHHGGAGTTAAGIAAGKPTVVVPFFGDQPFWGQMIARAGAGPEPIPFKQLTSDQLAESIKFALRPQTKLAAESMAVSINAENGSLHATQHVYKSIHSDSMRCDLDPSRVAVWRHKRYKLHLSTFALICLVDNKLVKPNHFRLLRHREWYVDGGAAHAFIGAIAALSGLVTAYANAISTFSDRLQGAKARAALSAVTIQTQDPEKNDKSRPINVCGSNCNEKGEGHDSKISADISTNISNIAAGKWTPQQYEAFAKRVSSRPFRSGANMRLTELNEPSPPPRTPGHAEEIARASGRLVADGFIASVKAPVAFFYNVANGFHNFPAYAFGGHEIRTRDNVTGLGNGCTTAVKSFVFGFYDAFVGLVQLPYQGARQDGALGLGRGVVQGLVGLNSNIGAAIFGVPGYTLKGLEKSVSRRRLNKLRAEVLLIRIRLGAEEHKQATLAEKAAVIQKWGEWQKSPK